MITTKQLCIDNKLKRIYSQDGKKHFDNEGVSHDARLVNCRTKKGFNSKENMIDMLKTDLNDLGRTFIYFASGTTLLEERYDLVPFDTFFLIDYLFDDYKLIITDNNKKIYCLPCDLITGLCILKEVGVQVDAICSLNDGQELGFGFYSTLSTLVLSVAEPLLKDDLIVFSSKSYQKSHGAFQVVKNFLSLPYLTKKELKIKDDIIAYNVDFDYTLLTTYHYVNAPVEVFHFSKKTIPQEVIIKYKGLNIHLVKGNIFNYYNVLDLSMLIFKNAFQYKHFKFNFNNVVEARGTYRLQGTDYDFNCQKNIVSVIDNLKIKSIGFTPQNNKSKDWIDLLNILCKSTSLTDIYFFHLNKNDFQQLYTYYYDQKTN